MEVLKKIGIMRLAIMGSVLAALVGFFFMVTSRISEPNMALLYADLDPSDGGQIVSRLEDQGIPVDIRNGGAQIYVPADQVARIRMLLAESGLPTGGSMGYEIFDRSDVLGSTSFVQDINRLRALEGELSRSIRSITNVASARVHLVLPKRELFSRESLEPTASVVLRMRGGRLTPQQVVAVQHLVASAVAGLSPGHISIIDERGTLLARGDDGDETAIAHGLEEAQRIYEDRTARTIESLLERSLGPGKIRAEVRAELDRNRTTENAELYDPESQVVRSTQSSEDTSKSSDTSTAGATTVTSNVPGAQAGSAGGGSSADNTRTEETINYEISRTVRSNIKEAGGIKRLSVAVLVDGTYTKAEDGTETYAPRSEDELAQVTKLVSSAVGLDEKRGDTLEVVNMRFTQLPDAAFSDSTDWFMGFSRHDIMRFAESIILSIVALLALLIGVKPIISRILAATPLAKSEMQPALAGVAAGAEGQPMALTAPEGTSATTEGPQPLPPADGQQTAPALAAKKKKRAISEDDVDSPFGEDFDDVLDRKNVIGKMKASSIKKIEDLIDDRTDEAVNQVRSWLNEGVG